MSYAVIPPRGAFRGLGLGSFQNLPPASSVASNAGKSYDQQANAALKSAEDYGKDQAIAFAEQQLSSYPSAAAVAAQYDIYAGYLKKIPGFNVSDLKDPSKVVGLMQQALVNYAADNGVPMNTPALRQQIEDYALHAAESQLLGFEVPSSWPNNLTDLKTMAVNIAVSAVVMETGIDPKIVTVTADALADGKLSEKECEAIGCVAGSIAGAEIATSFGIPAPIGSFIGGLVGTDIGGTFAEIFGAGDSGAKEVQGRLDKIRDWENVQLAQAQQICSTLRTTYWQTFDNLLLATEVQWETAELKVGWKFGLRWYGTEVYSTRGQAFSHGWDAGKQAFVGPEVSTARASRVGSGFTSAVDHTDNSGKTVTTYDTFYNYQCALEYGCPYPVVPSLPAPQGLSRDVQAFLARGALWVPPANRKYQCSFRFPPVATNFGSMTSDWIASVQADLQREKLALQALQILSVTVVGDLIKTASSNMAEKTMNDLFRKSAVELNQAAVQRSIDLLKAQATGKNLSDLLNYGVLFLGAGLLGATIWKRTQGGSR